MSPLGRVLQRRWTWIEGAAIAAAWLLLLGLVRARAPLSFDGVLGAPFASVLAALAALWLAPGYVLWRWLVGAPARHAPAWTFGLGLAWLLAPCALAMTAGTRLERLLDAVLALNVGLAAFHLAAVWLAPAHPRPPGPDAERWARPTPWIVAGAALVVARMLDVSTRRVHRLTYGGDEWVYMRAIRAFLDGPSVADPAEFDVWDLALALIVRLSGVQVIDVYRVHLPPVLLVAASLAFLALAERVLLRAAPALLALALQGLFALSDMHTRGEGMGMALLVRLLEDKYMALLLALPLAQAAFLDALRGSVRPLVVFALLAGAATVLQPFAIPWLVLTCGATCVAAAATRTAPASRRMLAATGILLAAGGMLAWMLRAIRPRAYFTLYDPDWPFNATLLEMSFRQLLILDLEKGWYMAHPWLLSHPLVIASLAASLLLLPRFRRSLEAQWLVLSTWLPVILVFNPITAVLVGRLVTPWRLYRLLWVVPVALVLAWALDAGLRALERRLSALRPAPARSRLAEGPLAVAALVLVALALFPRIAESARALRARNRILVKPTEKAFLHEVAALADGGGLGGRVLAPEGLSIRLPAWTTRLQPLPGLDIVRARQDEFLRHCARFHEAPSVGPQEVGLLRDLGVRYVIAEASSPVEAGLRAQPAAFRLIHRGPELALYEWRPERWTAAAP